MSSNRGRGRRRCARRVLRNNGPRAAQIAQLDGRMEEAEKLYRRSLELAEKAQGENHADTAHALNNLGAFLKDTDRPHEAEPLMRQAVRIRERSLGPSNSLTGQSLCSLGAIAALQEDMLVAEALLRQSLAVRLAATPPASRADVAESQIALTRLLLTIGQVTEAEQLAAAAFDNYRASFGPRLAAPGGDDSGENLRACRCPDHPGVIPSRHQPLRR